MWSYRNSNLKSSIKIEKLEIDFTCSKWNIGTDQFCYLLDDLHKQGFFKRLYCTLHWREKEDVERISSYIE